MSAIAAALEALRHRGGVGMARRVYTGVGSRRTPDGVCEAMTELARELASAGFTVRTGGAEGADAAFAAGAPPAQRELWVPWQGFGDVAPAEARLPRPGAERLAMQFHPRWGALSCGGRALHARNVHQVLGDDLASPSAFLVCWTEGGLPLGGTAQALRVAEAYGVPIFNLARVSPREVYEFAGVDDPMEIPF